MPRQSESRHDVRLRQARRFQPVDLKDADAALGSAHLSDASSAA
jgi:hypothetical protein